MELVRLCILAEVIVRDSVLPYFVFFTPCGVIHPLSNKKYNTLKLTVF